MLFALISRKKGGDNMAKIDSAYSYYLNTYGSSAVSRYDTHKKSELRNTYNRIVKLNKESPLYKISSSGDVKKFAIDIKENTRRIQNVASSLSEGEDGLWSNFQKKIAVSSDEDLVTAEYVGNGNDAENTDSFSIEVKQLACPQVNYGNYLKNNALDFAPGSYSFDLNTVSNSYEFQFNVNEDDTNRSVLAKLAKLINGAGVGLNAKLVMDDRDMSALKIESIQTGLEEGSKALFSIYPGTENASIQAMDTLGIDNTVSQAANSSFLLNGKEHSSLSNTFTVNNTFEVTLHDVGNENEPAVIGFKTNADAIADNVEKLVSSYNGIIETAHNYSSTQPESHKLYYDMSNVAYRFYNEFESMGLDIADDGIIHIDRDALTDAVTEEDSPVYFSALNRFKDTLKEKASQASLNPMAYVDKIVIAYKNPGHNFIAPYVTSIYSGMMLDQFC